MPVNIVEENAKDIRHVKSQLVELDSFLLSHFDAMSEDSVRLISTSRKDKRNVEYKVIVGRKIVHRFSNRNRRSISDKLLSSKIERIENSIISRISSAMNRIIENEDHLSKSLKKIENKLDTTIPTGRKLEL